MQQMLELVKGGKVDLLFLATPRLEQIDDELIEEQVGAFRYGFIASQAHFGSLQGRRLALAQINSHPIVILRPGNNTRDWLEGEFARQGLALNVQFETKTMAETDEFVRAGFGIGAVTIEVPEKPGALPEGTFEVKTRRSFQTGRYVALYRKDSELSGAAVDFLMSVRRGETGETA
jgi:hypothetical protein